MPKAKFETIYKDLKEKIEKEEYTFQDLLPSENTLVDIYSCSRNTVRRAIALLAEAGYVQSQHGKGVRVIYQPTPQTAFTIGGIESFHESAIRNHKIPFTKVIQFAEIHTDNRIAQKTGFPLGSEIYYIQRVRYLDDTPLIFDINIFLKSEVPGLTEEICRHSIYDYIENTLHMHIVTSKRQIKVQKSTEIDEEYLDLTDYHVLAVVTSQTYNANGVQFEYTESRHHPDYFCFHDTATRKHI
ncbi:trehalose operon repressor [Anaerosporobacter sp.]